jgi:hypothetical protein
MEQDCLASCHVGAQALILVEAPMPAGRWILSTILPALRVRNALHR